MGVADAEQPTFDLDGQVEGRARPELACVHVATDAPGRDDAVEPWLGRRHAEHAAERLDRDVDPVGEGRRAVLDLPDVEPGVGELIGEQPEARYERRPPVGTRLDGEDVDLEDVARQRALDEHRSAHGVDEAEIELGHRLVS
jgi:hypothetical protein